MTAVRRKLKRREGQRQYRRLFAIVVEGKTEQLYFQSFARAGIKVLVRQGKHSDPDSVLTEVNTLLETLRREGTLRADDQAWVVVDRDQWNEKTLAHLFKWAGQHRGRGIGISIPQFEYWLLLHFEDGTKIHNTKDVLSRLISHVPAYAKGKPLHLSETQVEEAIRRGKQHLPSRPQILQDVRSRRNSAAVTTVHFLVEKLIQG